MKTETPETVSSFDCISSHNISSEFHKLLITFVLLSFEETFVLCLKGKGVMKTNHCWSRFIGLSCFSAAKAALDMQMSVSQSVIL